MMDGPIENIEQLPIQVISRVMSFLNFKQRQVATLVCRRWYEAAQARELLESTLVCLCSDEDDWEVLGGICKRRIPNLQIDFDDYVADRPYVSNIGPEIAHHTDFVQNVKYIFLNGNFNAKDVIFCRRHFTNVKMMDMFLTRYNQDMLLGHDKVGQQREVTKALNGLQNVRFEIPFQNSNDALPDFLHWFEGVKSISFTSALDPYELVGGNLPSGEPFMYKVLTMEGLAQRLQELDLRWAHVSHQTFKELVDTPDLRLRSLRFSSCDGNGRNLLNLADSRLNSLTQLEVVCQGEEAFDIRYPGICYLMRKKPSLETLTLIGMKYPSQRTRNCPPARMYSRPLEKVAEEWLKMDEININQSLDGNTEVEVYFSFKDDRKVLTLFQPSLLDDEVMLLLAAQNPMLEAVFVRDRDQDMLNPMRMSILANSFPYLTELTIIEADLTNIDLSILGPSSFSRLTKLETLRLRYCTGVTDDDLISLHFPGLKFLVLGECSNVTDRAVISIASNNPTIQLLNLSSCSQVTDRGVAAIAEHLSRIRHLILIDCHKLTGESATTIAEKCQMLQTVDVTGCDQSFVIRLKSVQRTLPYLGSIKTKTTQCTVYISCYSDMDNSYNQNYW